MRTRQLGKGCAEWFFSVWPQRSWSPLNSAIHPGPCQRTQTNEEAEADALDTIPTPQPARKYPQQIHTNAHAGHGCSQIEQQNRFSIKQ